MHLHWHPFKKTVGAACYSSFCLCVCLCEDDRHISQHAMFQRCDVQLSAPFPETQPICFAFALARSAKRNARLSRCHRQPSACHSTTLDVLIMRNCPVICPTVSPTVLPPKTSTTTAACIYYIYIDTHTQNHTRSFFSAVGNVCINAADTAKLRK